jgi:hypothetical protein
LKNDERHDLCVTGTKGISSEATTGQDTQGVLLVVLACQHCMSQLLLLPPPMLLLLQPLLLLLLLLLLVLLLLLLLA